MIVKVSEMTILDQNRFANQVKDLIADTLKINLDSYIIVVAEKGMFGRGWDRWFKSDSYAILKMMKDPFSQHVRCVKGERRVQ